MESHSGDVLLLCVRLGRPTKLKYLLASTRLLVLLYAAGCYYPRFRLVLSRCN
jgi:hypothetical protein